MLGLCHSADGKTLGQIEIDADAVIMAAGSIGTPQLLWVNVAPNNPPLDRDCTSIQSSQSGILPEAVYARGATQGHYVDHSEDWVLLESNPILLGAFYQGFRSLV